MTAWLVGCGKGGARGYQVSYLGILVGGGSARAGLAGWVTVHAGSVSRLIHSELPAVSWSLSGSAAIKGSHPPLTGSEFVMGEISSL